MRYYLPLAIVLVLLPTVTAQAENATRFSNAVTQPGGSFSVDILIENDVILGGLTVPFRWSTPDLVLDSVRPRPERWEGIMKSIPGVPNVPERYSTFTLITSLIPGEVGWVPVGDGPVATLYFHVDPGAFDQYAFIDSVYQVLNDQPIRWVNWSSYTGGLIAPSVYPGRITIGDPEAVSIGVSPTAITVRAETGDADPAARSLNIFSVGGIEVDWGASWSSDWLELTPAVGKTPAFPTMYADPFFLLPGIYQDTIVITAPLADNSPLLVPVVFTVDTATPEPPSGFDFRLLQSRPSPYVTYTDPETAIPFVLEEPAHVRIEIFDILGRPVRTLAAGEFGAGESSVVWDGRDARGRPVASGHYLCRMTTTQGEMSRVIVLIR
ncbi:MAG TPA: FlgD immunoglobulin-like domain containing protein [bacterium]|nr:FlgD immunoglobulin-like domain containing protein [bacterium]